MMDPTPLGAHNKPEGKPAKGSAAAKPTTGSAPAAPAPTVVKREAPKSMQHDDDDEADYPTGVDLPEIPERDPLPEIPSAQPAPKRSTVPGDEQPGTGRAAKERDSLAVALRALVAACEEADKAPDDKRVKLCKGKAHREACELIDILDKRAAQGKKTTPGE